MLWILIALALPVALYFLVLRPRAAIAALTAELYGDKHFLAFAEALTSTLKDALQGIEEDGGSGDLSTEMGIRLFYTIERNEQGLYDHHYSLSLAGTRGRKTAWLARPFALFPIAYLDMPSTEFEFEQSGTGVFHVGFQLNEAEQKKFAGSSFASTTADELPALREKMGQLAERYT
jgi:hypothetical protein